MRLTKRTAIGGLLVIPALGGAALIAIFVVIALIVAMIFGAIGGGQPGPEDPLACAHTSTPTPTETTTTTGGGGGGLSADQLANVRTYIGIAKTMGVNTNGQIISVMMMLQESAIRVYANNGDNHFGYLLPPPGNEFWLGVAVKSLAYPHVAVGSDADSVGTAQQRASAGWGDTDTQKAIDDPDAAMARLMDVRWNAQAFFGGPGGAPNQGLTDIAGWEALPKGVAAQKVQGSAFPDRYAKWEPLATAIVMANQDAPALPLMDPAGAGLPGALCGGTGALHGLISRDNLSKGADDREMHLAGFAAEYSWRTLEPTEGNFNLTPIADTLAWANANGKRVRLRVFAGDEAPDDAKSIGGPPITIHNHDINKDVTIGRFWLPQFQDRYHALMAKIAEEFDGDPAFAEVNVCGSGLISCELGLLMLDDKNGAGKTNREQIVAAGFNDEARQTAVDGDIAFMQATFRTAWVTLWLHPWQTLTTVSSKQAMDIGDAAYLAWPQTTVGHTGVDESTLVNHTGPWPIYEHFLVKGQPFTGQTRSLGGLSGGWLRP